MPVGGTVDWLLSLTDLAEGWALSAADAWWVHLVVYVFAALDGFFPSVPSESTIVTLSSLWSTSGSPSIILLGLAAWIGAWTGDNLGYWIGRKVGWQRFKFLREGKGRRAVDAADRGLQRRALLFLMTARYVPFGRTAVNLVAGAVRYPHQQFWPRSLLATFVWAVYSCAIGAVAGAWLADYHLVAIAVALVAALVLALVVERVISAVHRVLDRRAQRRETNAVAERDSGTARGTETDRHHDHESPADLQEESMPPSEHAMAPPPSTPSGSREEARP